MGLHDGAKMDVLFEAAMQTNGKPSVNYGLQKHLFEIYTNFQAEE